MSDNIYDYLKENFNIEVTNYQFKRDYIQNPLFITNKHNSEKPFNEDLVYLYEVLNLSQAMLGKIFKIKRTTVQKWCRLCGLQKNQLDVNNSRKMTCQLIYGHTTNMKTDRFREITKRTKLERYGNENYCNVIKAKQTKLERYGNENYVNSEKRKRTTLDRYGCDWIVQTDNFKEAYKNTCRKKYGYDHPMKNKEIQEKAYSTQLKNGSWGKSISPQEREIKDLLDKKFLNILIQYRSEKYPFKCDFYIPSKDLYIEYQGYFKHGREPFIGSDEQNKIVNMWKDKNTEYYNDAIKTWTIRDPLKRKTAKDNNLNWIEFFNMKQFIEWYEQQ